MSDKISENHVDLPRLPQREPESHKGDYGRALIVGGSRGMAGAMGLVGRATLRCGAGLVKIAVPDPCLETVAGFDPSYMTMPLDCDDSGRIALAAQGQLAEPLRQATVLSVGPGLGRSEDLNRLVSWLYRKAEMPAVFDADALNAIATQPDVLLLGRIPAARILTPHPGEFARLVDQKDISRKKQENLAIEKAAQWNVVIVLKGHHTLVTDGQHAFRNTETGNPGMATGGSGDVLTGVLTGLLSIGLEPLAAARLGVYLHGLAGDLAAEMLGETSLTSSDILEFLPQAFDVAAAAGE